MAVDRPRCRSSRRRLLRAGGLTGVARRAARRVGGDDETESAPGRVGYAPPATPLPTVEIERRRATCARRRRSSTPSLDVYATITETGALDARRPGADRPPRRGPHRRHAETTAELTDARRRRAVRVRQRVVHGARRRPDPRRTSPATRAEDIPPSDDPARDVLAVANAFESMVGGDVPADRRAAHRARAARRRDGASAPRTARHAAAVAMLATGAPGRLRQPGAARRGASRPTRPGCSPVYAIPTQFGSLRRDRARRRRAATRPAPGSTFALETPADNSLRLRGHDLRRPDAAVHRRPYARCSTVSRPGGRGTLRRVEESRDSTGQGAGESQVGAT